MTAPADIAAVVTAGGEPARRSWLPALASRVPLDHLGAAEGAGLVLGLVDEPERQRQGAIAVDDRALLVVGGVRSGKSTALRTLASQVPENLRVWIGPDPESVWDALAAGAPPAPGSVVLVDDLDALAGRLPGEYARVAAEELERWIRGAGDLGLRVFATAQRLTGAAGRLADLFPRRLVLGSGSRAEHLALGGDGADYAPDLPPGRGTLDRRTVQVAVVADAASPPRTPGSAPSWQPGAGVSGYVVRHAPAGVVERWERTGVRIRGVVGPGDVAEPEPEGRVVIVGDPEEWMGHPRLLARVRSLHSLVIDASCAADYRLLTGDRELPPLVAAGLGRAWECRAGRRVRRIALAGALGDAAAA